MAIVKALPVYSNGAGNPRPTPAKVYPKAGGTPYTGYVIGGRTYKDPYGKERIDYGSRVELDDGRTYVYTAETGGVPDSATTMRDYKGNFDSMINDYRNSGKYSDEAIDAAVSKKVAGLEWDKNDASAVYNQRVKEAKDEYRRASNPYGAVGQRLAALGLGDSGYAESTYAKIGNAYQQSISNAADTYAKTVAKINSEITRAYSEGEIEKAKAWQAIERDITGFTNDFNGEYATMQENAYRDARESGQREEENRRWQTEWDYKLNRDAKADMEKSAAASFDMAIALIKLGISNDDIAKALGITPQQAEEIAKGYRKEESPAATATTRSAARTNYSKSSSSSSKSNKEEKKTSETAKPKLTEEEIKQHKAEFYKILGQVISNEGMHTNRQAREEFEIMLARAVATGYIPEEEAKKMEPPKIYINPYENFRLNY